MNAFSRLVVVMSLSALFAAASDARGGTIGPRLTEALRGSAAAVSHLVWVSFTDKGAQKLGKTAVPSTLVTEQSLRRRANVLPKESLVDDTDLPVNESYVTQLAATGAVVQNRSKWLNAVSLRATVDQIQAIAALSFVREVELVGRYRRSLPPPPSTEEQSSAALLPKTSGSYALDYGPSINQVLLINVPALHAVGNIGQGVLVGVFDNGFRLPSHEAFDSMKIFATYDFIENKVSVVPGDLYSWFTDNDGGIHGVGDHGVNTLSTIGGYKSGQLIGPAYGASFILARTENDSSETPFEEDKWVRAIEWADSLGVQVTSTSLGYLDYDSAYTSWTWEDMNGRTTVISRAAAMAVRKGILVVNAAGNENSDPTHNTLVAPADADSVVAAGAVYLSGKRASFSSVGPSTATPPRIKPDLMAPGTSVYVANAYNSTGYTYSQGTSFACPLVAGVAALLIKAHPTASPMAIVNAMKATASQASAPDRLMGWGLINALAAHNQLSGPDTNGLPLPDLQYALSQNYPNPFNPGTTIFYELPFAAAVTLSVYDILGREVKTLARGQLTRGSYNTGWDGTDERGVHVAAGVYIYRLNAVGLDGVEKVMSKTMLLVR